MMISEETLMAFADGEADQPTRLAVEQAMREDPSIARRIARHRALRERLQRETAIELAEPVPDRLLAVLREMPGTVVNLRDARTARARAAKLYADKNSNPGRPARLSGFWRRAAAIAASVLVGLGIGYGVWQGDGLPIGRGAAGTLVAKGFLGNALSHQLASEQASTGAVRIGVSYVAKSGEYCRAFTLAGSVPAAGIACQHAGQWQIDALTQGSGGHGDAYRTAATTLSPAILKMIEDDIQGEPLDAAAETAARQHGWQSSR